VLSCALACFEPVVSNGVVFAGLDFEGGGIGFCCAGFPKYLEEGPPAVAAQA